MSAPEALPTPGKIIAVHLSYRSRAEQRGRTPENPSYFFKPSSSVSASGGTIERPLGAELLAFEGEIALIIGTDVRRVSAEDGWAAVSGVTAANDFGIYDFRAADKGSNVRSKGGDGYTPLGPAVIPADQVDPGALRVRTWVNGEIAQDDTTAGLLFPFCQLVADLSQMMTLHAGDIILTGTPAGSSVVSPGDVVEVEVDAPTAPGSPTTGKLVTTVTAGDVPFSDVGTKPSTNDLQRTEAWGSREAAGLPAEERFELSDDMREKLSATAVATLSAALRKRGHVDIFIEGVRSATHGEKMFGLARTLRFVPFRPDLFASHGGGYNAQKRAFDAVNPGEVLVMEARGESGTGTVGDVLALRAQVRGAAGIVTDGGVRDFEEVSGFDIPVFSKGAHPSVLGRRHVPWDTDVTIACGGAAVQPGDLIVGDGDGVIVIPPQLAREVIDEAYEQERADAWIAEQVANGEAIDGLFPMNAEWRERYRAWQSTQ
ncbi:2-keto-4-pentenoate hydratase/2-oxohepta-3-ene-1,7-dioic acid hydratase (catechol pathway) [Paramicrobacterium humi]|uniref:2-keto-4-pentenoate hydratase/2-oxohepta-3-ene-1,7-dioic acid hydratase (Catechol pathway) n=1 Tax=Paramicrobacterium humi TaxID=640635 RepID=A0A1H4NMY4_9MICO|nr:fumarylacetoacetate hydrolase family protein [Microbacterium humi]SEB96454.1 2-keto-4-pentenoate hydratase/2-oxohepta-3-ene-1,7-dioic acid hydratase (catechol pathway) [Microbacterium humi]